MSSFQKSEEQSNKKYHLERRFVRIRNLDTNVGETIRLEPALKQDTNDDDKNDENSVQRNLVCCNCPVRLKVINSKFKKDGFNQTIGPIFFRVWILRFSKLEKFQTLKEK